ncbi:MAG: DUF1049 domain-containing protein [Deltaproteobacteria bacterium]|nr:DUF1049 domain-containing protein [Deltaproteobacteria bacterium]
MVKVLKTILVTLLFIVGITFSMENAEPLRLRYYFGLETPPIPLFLLVLFAVLLGVLLAGLGFLFDQWSLKRMLREKDRAIASLEGEIKAYQERRAPGGGPQIKEQT